MRLLRRKDAAFSHYEHAFQIPKDSRALILCLNPTTTSYSGNTKI